jgi:ethanolamine ammonia-lyase small subunit
MADMRTPVSPPSRDADDLWTRMRRLTAARIGLKRSGASLTTQALLDFQLAHARARDAVHRALDEDALIAGLAGLADPVLRVASAAGDRQTYLMRPDLGRRLAQDAQAELAPHAHDYDVAFVIADGLAAGAVQAHAAPVLSALLPGLRAKGWRIAPLAVARQGRVAIGDAIATALHADCAAVLIGERPGLSAADSMGAYLTWKPHAGSTDADRNCVSNIRPDGVGYADAASKLAHLLGAMRTRQFSGVRLKDDSERRLIGGG